MHRKRVVLQKKKSARRDAGKHLTGSVCVCFSLFSPRGDRFRSRVELVSVLNGILDLTTFDYKTGQFCDGKVPPIRIRSRKVSNPLSRRDFNVTVIRLFACTVFIPSR